MGWRRSADRAVTTAGDETGLHVLVADRREAYRWRVVATLAEPTLVSDQWIGQLCVTGSGSHVVVVYAPRTFTNYTLLMERGAFAAVVDLDTGEVAKLAERVTLAYYNPSCGTGDTAVLSRLERSPAEGEPATTWIGTVDAAAAEIKARVAAAGQLTSAVPVDGRVIAARGYGLVEVDRDSQVTTVAHTNGAPLRLLPDGQRGVAFQVARSEEVDLVRLVDGQLRTLATVPLGAVKLRPGAGGDVYAVGERAVERVAGRVPPVWQVVDALPDSQPSSDGGLVVTRARTMREAAGRIDVGAVDDARTDTVHVTARLRSGMQLEFTARSAGGGPGSSLSPSLGGRSGTTPDGGGVQADHSGVPWDPDRACAVARNDPTVQVYQPSPEQVEWAANLAVRGQLDFVRPANWLNNGLQSYIPQVSFPPLPLAGGGHVPAQVYLGILAQESNLWQASWHVVDALAGNPLTSSGFYGLDWENPDPTQIDWSTHDCGYGAAQVTTGMHSDDTGETVNGVVMTEAKQKAVVTDYATNVAAGLRILQSKWNQTFQAGIIANDGDPQYIENWFFAVWAYNSGVQPDERFGNTTGCTPSPSCTDEHGHWGLGWSNNPASPLYPEDRQMFLTAPLDHPDVDPPDQVGYDNAKHPNHWSYPERVMGFAYTSLIRFDYQSQSWEDTYWSAGDPLLFRDAQPGRLAFCVAAVNACDPAAPPTPPGGFPGYPPALCQRPDLHCWWHEPATWEPDCEVECGIENRRFTTVEPRPFANSIYDSQCGTTGLPGNARVIDDIDSVSPLGPQGCPRNWTVGGSFSLNFESVTGGAGDPIYPGKVDFHQIGGGFGGHFWFAHSRFDQGSPMRVTGTWTPTDRFDGWVRVLVHLPDHGAHTQQAKYKIHTGDGTRVRYIPTRRMEHTWVALGTYHFSDNGAQRVELSNITQDGRGVEDVAWDALAFVPLPAKPQHFVVAMGDSYISGEGAGDYDAVTDTNYGDHGWNACRRSQHAWPNKLVLPGTGSSIGARAGSHEPSLDLQFTACSGATADEIVTTTDPFYWQNPPSDYGSFTSEAEGQFGEISQIESGVLSADTTMVLLSAGGNDADFPDVLQECAESNCASFAREQEIQQDIVDARAKISDLIDAIRAGAPNAKIVLAGYPQVFSEEIYQNPLHPGFCVAPAVYTMDEAIMLNSLAHYLRDHQKNLVMSKGGDVQFVDLVNRFGDHGTCSDTEEIHAAVQGPTGDGDFRQIEGTDMEACFGWTLLNFCISRSSFHPKQSGTTRYATAVADRLACAEFCVGSTPPGGKSSQLVIVP
ncbi:MAG: SGNH/GDSL hydrolase family protein [Natronosporangium sp.]